MECFDSRLEKCASYCSRLFIHKDFSDPKKSREITSEIVLTNSFLSQKEETHLFKKMNYFKYKAKKLLESRPNPSKTVLAKIESIIDEAKKVRNLIAESNFRLANQLLKFNVSYYKKNGLVDSLISDAHFDIIKSVDYFDWTRGNRFSTYATWVLKKNFFRESKSIQKKLKRTVRLEDSDASIESTHKDSDLKMDLDYEAYKKIVSSLLAMLESSNCSKNQSRQVFILESYFGLNGQEDCTLEQISSKLGVTKERVRQLKEKSLTWLRDKVKQLNLEYDTVFDSVRY